MNTGDFAVSVSPTTNSSTVAEQGSFVPLPSPTRICDTRSPSFIQTAYPNNTSWDSQCVGNTLSAGSTLNVKVAGYTGDVGAADVVPSSATAVVLNVTEASNTKGGFLTIYPSGVAKPIASNLNFLPPPQGPIANLVQVSLGVDGAINVFNYAGFVDITVDVMGYFVPVVSASEGNFVPLPSPTRICDTRSSSFIQTAYPNNTSWDSQCVGNTLSAGSTLNVKVAGYTGDVGAADVVPSGATAVVLNVTEASNTKGGFLTIYPSGVAKPIASNLNFTPSSGALPNGVVVGLSSGGSISVYNKSGNTNVAVDVLGYFTSSGRGTISSGGMLFTGLPSPTRICDTRSPSFIQTAYPNNTSWDSQCVGNTLSAGSTLNVKVAGYTGDVGAADVVPSGATAVVLNVTEASNTKGGFLTIYPSGVAKPIASNLNFTPSSGALPNFVTVSLPTSGSNAGEISIFNPFGSVNITIDIVGYYYYIPAPTLTSISPTSGPVAGGQSFTIAGTNFSTASGGTTVSFGSTPATSVSCSSTTSCSGTTPAGPSGGGNVTVTATTSGGTSNTVNYDYTTATSPTLTSISPTSGPAAGGTSVTLTGTNFVTTSGGTTVDFGPGNQATSVSCSSTTSCSAVSPSGTGTVSVTVTTGGGTSSGQSYTYIPAPTLSSISPTSGPEAGGQSFTITGTNFSTASGGTTVDFGPTPATSVSCSSTTSCSGTTPAGPSGGGSVNVTVTTSGGTSNAVTYTYIPAPTLSSISPTSGPQAGGQSFTITGTNFSTASGGTTVDFGSTPATSVSCSSTTSCSAVSPSGTGTVSVTVTTSGGTSGGQSYTYIPAPTLTSISPTSGPAAGGTTVTLTGTNFVTTSGGTTVDFGPGNQATSVSCSSTTSCTAV
ncbi:MAG: IPT/TIG domain-containing protein, partial [Actinobacteria bacterium]|nr:IPT/TIG domain-containing protein [Actinomycetota bacterium]